MTRSHRRRRQHRTREFTLIKGHVLELKQKDVLALGARTDITHVSPDGPVRRHTIDIGALLTSFPKSVAATQIWNNSHWAATGAGVTVAVLDSGVNETHPDFRGNVIPISVSRDSSNTHDDNGHGTHVIGIVKGRDTKGKYIGVAPDARVISVRVADANGMAHGSDLLRGLQWCYDNRAQYNIKAVNISMTAADSESYKTSPICAAVEQLWFNGVAVIVAAGNIGNASDAAWYAPANDPYVITVGALDDNQTASVFDDILASFSSRGKTQDGYAKPELLAPGRNIYSALASSGCTFAMTHPDHIASDGEHFRASGTSMASPMVTGAVALLLERFPALQPDQIKWLMQKTAQRYGGSSYSASSIGELDISQAMSFAASGTVGFANQGLTPNHAVSPSDGSVAWGSAYWDTGYWDTAYWDSGYWDTVVYS